MAVNFYSAFLSSPESYGKLHQFMIVLTIVFHIIMQRSKYCMRQQQEPSQLDVFEGFGSKLRRKCSDWVRSLRFFPGNQ